MSKTIPLPVDYRAPRPAGSRPVRTEPSLPYSYIRPPSVPPLPSKVRTPEVRDGMIRVADLLAWLSDEANEASRDPERMHVYAAYRDVIEALS